MPQECAAAATDGEPEGTQTLEQIQQEIVNAANATKAAQQRASDQKTAADLQEQARVQLLQTPATSPEDLLRVQAEQAQKAAQEEAIAEAKRQARIALQAERDRLAAAEQAAAAEEQRAESIARSFEDAKA